MTNKCDNASRVLDLPDLDRFVAAATRQIVSDCAIGVGSDCANGAALFDFFDLLILF